MRAIAGATLIKYGDPLRTRVIDWFIRFHILVVRVGHRSVRSPTAPHPHLPAG